MIEVNEVDIPALLSLFQELINDIPTNWLDPLLTGEKAVLPSGKSWDCLEIERLLLAIKSRMEVKAYKLSKDYADTISNLDNHKVSDRELRK